MGLNRLISNHCFFFCFMVDIKTGSEFKILLSQPLEAGITSVCHYVQPTRVLFVCFGIKEKVYWRKQTPDWEESHTKVAAEWLSAQGLWMECVQSSPYAFRVGCLSSLHTTVYFKALNLKTPFWAEQWVKTFASKSDHQSLIPGTQTIDRENWLLQGVLWVLRLYHTHIHT